MARPLPGRAARAPDSPERPGRPRVRRAFLRSAGSATRTGSPGSRPAPRSVGHARSARTGRQQASGPPRRLLPEPRRRHSASAKKMATASFAGPGRQFLSDLLNFIPQNEFYSPFHVRTYIYQRLAVGFAARTFVLTRMSHPKEPHVEDETDRSESIRRNIIFQILV